MRALKWAFGQVSEIVVWGLIIWFILTVAGCTTSTPEPEPEPLPTLAEAIAPFLISAPLPTTDSGRVNGFGVRVRYVIQDLVQFSGAGMWWDHGETVTRVSINKTYTGMVHASMVDQLGDNMGMQMEYYIANLDTLHLYLVRYDHDANKFEIRAIKMRWVTM